MSKANRQSKMLLCMIAGVFGELYHHKYFARVDINQLCYEHYTGIISDLKFEWPKDSSSGDADKIKLQLDEWATHLRDLPNKPAAQAYIYTASRILSDLLARLKNKKKLEIVQRLVEPIETLEKFVNPDGVYFPDDDRSNGLIDALYKIIDWEY